MSKNREFIDSALVNDRTYFDYLKKLKKIALSIFEWVNLPEGMDARFLEKCLYYKGKAALLKDKKYNFINTQVASGGNLNIYGLPNVLNCYSFGYQSQRRLYIDNRAITKSNTDNQEYEEAIYVLNDWEATPTCEGLEMYAYRLYEAERTTDTNIKLQKFSAFILGDEKQRLTLKNLINQYDGNQPFIFGDKNRLNATELKSLNFNIPFIADKLTDYKKEIWNEALMFLGVNSLQVNKKERLVTEEANSNNECTNYFLQSYLEPRKQACTYFNHLFNLTGENEISVRVRSDLKNVIKEVESSIFDKIPFKESEEDE